MPNPRRTRPAPWMPVTQLSGPTTLPIEFGAPSTTPSRRAAGGAQVERAACDENWAEHGREMGVDLAENWSLLSGLNC
jgi:hypothetical protein